MRTTMYVVDAVLLDYQKAFDTVPGQRLIHKLKIYITGVGLLHGEMFQDFLTNR